MVNFIRLLVLVVLMGFSHSPLWAQTRLRVAVAGQEPFVKKDTVVSGVAIEIWEKIAASQQFVFDYVPYNTVEEGMKAVASGKADILVGDIPIIRKNLSFVEFTQPFFHSGLQILVCDKQKSTWDRLLRDFCDLVELKIFWFIVAGVIIFTCVVYAFERQHNPDFPKTRKDGIAEAFYYVMSLTLTGKSVYKGFPGVLGRLVLILWIILGMLIMAYVTSTITSRMTVEKLTSKINGPQDLVGKSVGTVKDSVALDYLKRKSIAQLDYPNLEAAVKGLVAYEVDAIVDDAPILEMLDFKNPQIPVGVVGPIFEKMNYGFALPVGSALRITINHEILKLQESRALIQIFALYFGESSQL